MLEATDDVTLPLLRIPKKRGRKKSARLPCRGGDYNMGGATGTGETPGSLSRCHGSQRRDIEDGIRSRTPSTWVKT